MLLRTGADPGILERGRPVRGRSPEPSAKGAMGLGASPENFEKLDAISCNLAYTVFLGSEWPRISFKIGPLQNKKQ